MMDQDEVEAFLDTEFPQIRRTGNRFDVSRVEGHEVDLAFEAGEDHLRPGGSVSGPALFALADVAAYLSIVAQRGTSARDAVTTNLSINFLRRPAPGTLRACARTLKLGARLSVVEVAIVAADGAPVAHAVATYAMPKTDELSGIRIP